MKALRACLAMADAVWEKADVTDPRTGTQAAFRDESGTRYIVFEATDDWTDLLTHLQLWPAQIGGAWAHAGFVRAYRSIRDWVWRKAMGADSMGMDVVFCGHSLGGALAQIASWDFPKHSRVITTGCPRVWFGQEPPLDCARFETPNDPIPHLPPFYKSAGVCFRLTSAAPWHQAHLPGAYKSTPEAQS